MNRILFSLIVILSICNVLKAQEVIGNAGTNYVGSTSQVDWTIGEVLVESIEGTDAIITQGFHQTYLNSVEIKDLPDELGKINVYPNPASDWLEMHIQFKEAKTTIIQWFTPDSKLLSEKTVSGIQFKERQEFQDWTDGIYLLVFLVENERYAHWIVVNKN